MVAAEDAVVWEDVQQEDDASMVAAEDAVVWEGATQDDDAITLVKETRTYFYV